MKIAVARDYQQTHENLLSAAKDHCLRFGFERASIREICKSANVTNGAFYTHFRSKEALFGALVDPVIQAIGTMYSDSVNEHFRVEREQGPEQLWSMSENTLCEIIEYIYDHLDIFKLILVHAAGTRYDSFLDDIVQLEMESTLRLVKELKLRGSPINDLEENEWRMLMRSYYTAIAQIVTHGYEKDEALRYVHTLATFFSSGWRAILGI